MAIEPWISQLAPISTRLPELVGFATDGGAPLGDARGQIVTTDIGWWEFEATFRIIRGTALAKAWTALYARLKGRGGQILVPIFQCYHKPVYERIGYSDGTSFRDGTRFLTPAISAKLRLAAALNATELSITVEKGSIEAGDYFSIGNRMYCINTCNPRGSWYDVVITPWLRAAAAQNTVCDFVNPAFAASLVDPSDMVLDFEDTRVATPTLRFKES